MSLGRLKRAIADQPFPRIVVHSRDVCDLIRENKQLRYELDEAKQPRFGEPGYRAPPQRTHLFKAAKKAPWFCVLCGYPEHERLKHHPAHDQQ